MHDRREENSNTNNIDKLMKKIQCQTVLFIFLFWIFHSMQTHPEPLITTLKEHYNLSNAKPKIIYDNHQNEEIPEFQDRQEVPLRCKS